MPQDFASGNEELGGDLYLVLELGGSKLLKPTRTLLGFSYTACPEWLAPRRGLYLLPPGAFLTQRNP